MKIIQNSILELGYLKKKFKGFFYYLREIDIKLKKKEFLYMFENNFKLFLENSLSKKVFMKLI